jgi:hypothetical protein
MRPILPTRSAPATPQRYALPRNVYHTKQRFFGQYGWFAITSTGQMIGPYRARHYESDAELVALLITELDAADPVTAPRHLALVREDAGPTASVGVHRYRSWLLGARASLRRLPRRAPSAPR